jgi:hypothetical protein
LRTIFSISGGRFLNVIAFMISPPDCASPMQRNDAS